MSNPRLERFAEAYLFSIAELTAKRLALLQWNNGGGAAKEKLT